MRADIAWEHELARLRALRQARGWSQMDLAEQLDCSAGGLHEWEAGKRQPRITTWLRWRAALGLDTPWGTRNSAEHRAWRASLATNKRKR